MSRSAALRPSTAAVTAILILCGLLTGCRILPEPQPDPTRYFVLDDPAPASGQETPSGAVIGLTPIRVPAYLADSRAMAVRNSANEVTYREFDRWAEPLDAGVARVFRGALLGQPGVGQVLTTPFPLQPKRDFDLAVQVTDAAGTASGTVRFAVDYALTKAGTGEIIHRASLQLTTPDWNGDSAELAHALSQAITAAAQEIAAALP